MGSGSNKAQKQAQQAEDERQAQIKASTDAINAIFSDPAREQQYADLAKSTTDYYTGDVNRQQDINARKLQFALARSGQAGGSEGAYQGKVLGQDYSKALDVAAQRGYQAGAGARQADEQARTQMLGLAQTGLDATTAAQEASRSLQSNLLASTSAATANQLGDLFGDLGDVYQQSQNMKALRSGQMYGYGPFYQPRYGIGSNTGAVSGAASP